MIASAATVLRHRKPRMRSWPPSGDLESVHYIVEGGASQVDQAPPSRARGLSEGLTERCATLHAGVYGETLGEAVSEEESPLHLTRPLFCARIARPAARARLGNEPRGWETRLSASESQDTENILLRLRRIEGQVRGLQHMIEERRNCEEIITQLMAVRAALDQVGLAAMQKYMAECVPDASEEARANLRRAMVLLLKLSR